MDEQKLNELLQGVYDSLTGEQKEKAKACRTTEELIALAAQEGVELPDEMMGAVAGGSETGNGDGSNKRFPTPRAALPELPAINC